MERIIRTVSKVVLPKVPILAAVALLEDTEHQTARIVVLRAEEVEKREEEIQAEARRLMPKLPFDDIDLLIIDRIGKNISGAGMDPNITGRGVHGYSSKLSEHTTKPIIHRLYVRDLTPESHGNAIGIGMADFTTTRLAKSIDSHATGMNALTSLSINSFEVPLAFDNDQEAIRRALESVPRADGRPHRVVRIQDTLNLLRVEVSESYRDDLATRSDLEATGPARDVVFDAQGNLPPIVG
jgi:hypothetical protein